MAIENEPIDADPTVQVRDGWRLEWTGIIAGALVAAALSVIIVTFGTAVGLGVSFRVTDMARRFYSSLASLGSFPDFAIAY